MKRYISLLSLLLLLVSSCNSKGNLLPDESIPTKLELSVGEAPLMRSFVKDPNSDQVIFRWDKGALEIQLVFKQGNVLTHIGGMRSERLEDGKSIFTIAIPAAIDATKPFDLYGIVADKVKVQEGKILVSVAARSTYELLGSSHNRDGFVPVYFELKGVRADRKKLSTHFRHLGAMAVISIKNSSAAPLETAGFAILPHTDTDQFYYKGALPYEGNTRLPYLDLLDPNGSPHLLLSNVDYPRVDVAPGDVVHVGFWFMPFVSNSSVIDLAVYRLPDQVFRSTASLPARSVKSGEAYAIYAEWNGLELRLLDEEPQLEVPADLPVAHFETAKGPGDVIHVGVQPRNREAERMIFVDLNGNGQPDKGEYITEFTNDIHDGNTVPITLQGSTFSIYGDVELLQVINSKVTGVDLSEMPEIRSLDLWRNELVTVDLTHNTKLNKVALQANLLTNVTFPRENRVLSLYLDNNRLKSLDVSALAQLTEANIAENLLDQVALNKIYTDLPVAQDKTASWKYHLYVYDNPGVDKSDRSIATKKGWRVEVNRP